MEKMLTTSIYYVRLVEEMLSSKLKTAKNMIDLNSNCTDAQYITHRVECFMLLFVTHSFSFSFLFHCWCYLQLLLLFTRIFQSILVIQKGPNSKLYCWFVAFSLDPCRRSMVEMLYIDSMRKYPYTWQQRDNIEFMWRIKRFSLLVFGIHFASALRPIQNVNSAKHTKYYIRLVFIATEKENMEKTTYLLVIRIQIAICCCFVFFFFYSIETYHNLPKENMRIKVWNGFCS